MMPRRKRILRYFGYALLAGVGALLAFALYCDLRVTGEFEGRRFSLPARIYARPIELHAGFRIRQVEVEEELKILGYQSGEREQPGWYVKDQNNLEIAVRPFTFWDGAQPPLRVKVEFESGAVKRIVSGDKD